MLPPVSLPGQTDGTILHSQHGSQLHSRSNGAAGPAWARLLPDVIIAGLVPSHRLRAADNSGHQTSHVPTAYSACTAVLQSWACCCHHSEVGLRRTGSACWGVKLYVTWVLLHISPFQLHHSPCPTAGVTLAAQSSTGKTQFCLCC